MLEFIKEKVSCWEYFQTVKLPIYLYGMGNGAKKILDTFAQHGITARGIFASDEYVRGHSFEGFEVLTLSQLEERERAGGFIIVLAFAAGYRELYEKINALAKKYTLLAPDLPIAGGGLFTYDYALANAEKIERVYALLADDASRETYAAVINYKISGNIEYLNSCTAPRSEIYGRAVCKGGVYVDLGAYNGDTVSEYIGAVDGGYKAIYAFEPNAYNFKRLKKNIGESENIKLFNGAAWSYGGYIPFTKGEGRMTGASKTGEYTVACYTVDDTVAEQASLIKIDAEGAEREALLGAERHIKGGAKIICSLYHRNEDMFELPLYIHELNPKLKLYIRHHLYIPAWETNLYAV